MSLKNLSGKDLMNALNDGSVEQRIPSYITEVREKVSEGCAELIEIGARIRPLYEDEEQIGWVRGVYGIERKQLKRWLHKPTDFAVELVRLGTSLSDEKIYSYTLAELAGLARLIEQMTTRDVSLFPFLSSFVTTIMSEYIWHGRGKQVLSFENKLITMPDGKKIRLLMPSEHARLWASLCMYREGAKRRLDENYNALMIVRSMIGKNANPVETALKNVAKTLVPDAIEPWLNIVRSETNFEDGWAHSEDSSLEGVLRELEGMIAFDKHEQLMAKFYKQQLDEAEAQKQKIEELLAKRNYETGVIDQSITVVPKEELLRRRAEVKNRKRPRPIPESTEVELDPQERMNRYQ